MKKRAIIDEAALIEALQGGVIAVTGLDVFAVEPLQAGNPLLAMENVVLTPHQGTVTAENTVNFFEAAAANVRAWLDGNVINELP
jgi:phosphoglycerate dehydrogenase-like enzyme